jgi:hypothetical protein
MRILYSRLYSGDGGVAAKVKPTLKDKIKTDHMLKPMSSERKKKRMEERNAKKTNILRPNETRNL